MPNISDRLRETRETLGLSQQALAERCGVVIRSQRNYESGERSPDAAYLAALAGVGADVTYILTGKRLSQWEQDWFAETAKAIKELEPDGIGPLHDSLAKARINRAMQELARQPRFDEFQTVCSACSDEDFAFVMESALALARRLAKKT